ncbi:GP46-like surface antigen, putative [Bodo saltans]|uniref:GP46-like surface antigen, putative n=1 Tax=Bodo saltans TaxID=75058 RepID=A0A0S4JEH8_BODSA|nr:GP46-like surface antigen, putative [Bodo saltans]|eukprot:CUG87392.1 GP46-like surface antigen, putative [Bodo saltans]
MTAIKNLVLFQNKLNGTLPRSFGNLTNLKTLVLAQNSFSGAVPFDARGSLSNIQMILLQTIHVFLE